MQLTSATIPGPGPPSSNPAREHFYNVSDGHTTFTQPQPTSPPERKAAPKTKARKDQLSEKHMRAADRLAFWEAKKKELGSFFQNDVLDL